MYGEQNDVREGEGDECRVREGMSHAAEVKSAEGSVEYGEYLSNKPKC